jgi:hypothetical protein
LNQPDLPLGFRPVSGKRRPPQSDKEYTVMFRNGFVDWKTTYRADQLVWVHDGSSWDVVAVCEAGGAQDAATWNPKSGGY